MATVIWSPTARADLVRIRDHIGQDNPFAAARVAERLILAGESLAVFPDRGRLARRGYREWTIIYPYIIRYRVRRGVIEIARIKHGAQRPD